MLDRERRGAIPTPLFDRTMLLFSEVLTLTLILTLTLTGP